MENVGQNALVDRSHTNSTGSIKHIFRLRNRRHEIQSGLVNPCFFNPHVSQSEHILMRAKLFG